MKHNSDTNQFEAEVIKSRPIAVLEPQYARKPAEEIRKPMHESESEAMVSLALGFGLVLGIIITIFFTSIMYKEPTQYDRADVNHDGKVTVTDLLIVKQTILGITPEAAP